MSDSAGVSVLGASGYVGGELLRLLANHPKFSVEVATADSSVGRRVEEIFPHLRGATGQLPLRSLEAARREIAGSRVVFSALPHGEGANILSQLENELIVDLSGDFRLEDSQSFEQWYGISHPQPKMLGSWNYGIPELFRAEIARSKRIANPGCYATAAILATAPLLKRNLATGVIDIVGLSGTSGAGKAAKAALQFSQVFEDIRSYKVGSHQHTPEIEQALSQLSSREVKVSFVPHLIPIARGLQVTCSVELVADAGSSDVAQAFVDTYADEPFVRFIANGEIGTKDVRGSNMALVTAVVDTRCRRVITRCVIDNLLKGAAGQAIQNANIACGIDETAGLPTQGISP